MIYLDSSVAIAHLLGEDRRPPSQLWEQRLVASKLLEYEVWTRVHARGLTRTHGDALRSLFEEVSIVDLSPVVLARALEPFPLPVRTLDALHLATMEFLRGEGLAVELASYDQRLTAAARALGISLYHLP